MFESKRTPGKKFGSAMVGKRYDAAGEEPKAEPVKAMGKPDMNKNAGAPQGGNAVDEAVDNSEAPEQVVQAHGPATHIHIKHDHAAGKHHTTSHHEDGHVHESDHQTAQEAHQAGGNLANVDMKKSDEAGDQQGAASESDGFEMPDLS